MTSGISISGITSGMDTTSIIQQLMAAKSNQITLKKTAMNEASSKNGALGTLNTALQGLQGIMTNKTSALDFKAYASTSTSPAVTADASKVKGASAVPITVDQTATRKDVLSAAAVNAGASEFAITVNGASHTVSADSSDFYDVAKAINNAGLGVRATRVSAGTDQVTGEQLFRLEVSSIDPGAKNDFTISGTGTDLFSAPGSATLSQAQDAQITLFAGTAAAQTLTSSSNTFTDIADGLNVTVSSAAVGAGVITVGADTDRDQVTAKAKNIVDQVQNILTYISSQTKVTTGTDTATGSVLTGNSMVREIGTKLSAAIVDGFADSYTPTDMGISVDRYGTLTFDETAFNEAFTKDPEKIAGYLEQISSRVAQTTAEYSDKYNGALTKTIKSNDESINKMQSAIDAANERAEISKSRLEAKFAAMEVSLTKYEGIQNALLSQIASLEASWKDN